MSEVGSSRFIAFHALVRCSEQPAAGSCASVNSCEPKGKGKVYFTSCLSTNRQLLLAEKMVSQQHAGAGKTGSLIETPAAPMGWIQWLGQADSGLYLSSPGLGTESQSLSIMYCIQVCRSFKVTSHTMFQRASCVSLTLKTSSPVVL